MTAAVALQRTVSGAPGPVLEVADLTVGTVKPDRELVHGVSFTLQRGRRSAIVGESGSGKSLTGRAILGLLPPGLWMSGTVHVTGRSGAVLQDPFGQLNPLLTAAEHVAESLVPARRSRSEVRAEVHERLAEVGLDEATARRHPFQLSGGQRQRVALASALAAEPDVLVADEPTTALDTTTQRDILGLLDRLAASRGMSLILITHDLRVAFGVCDNIMIMYAGEVVESGDAGEVATRPRHPYTTALLSSEPPADRYVARLPFVPGSVPRAHEVGSACSFAPRCLHATEACRHQRPVLRLVTGTPPGSPTSTTDANRRPRWSACLFADNLADDPGGPGEPPAGATATDPSVPSIASGPVTALVRVTDARKAYRTRTLVGTTRVIEALQGVSFQVEAGRSVGLVGESGSGKSTLAKAVLGLTSLDEGQVTVDGMTYDEARALPRRRRRAWRTRVQAVFQDPYASLNPARTVGATLTEVVELVDGRGASGRRVQELLQMVGLPADHARRRPVMLSGGERQRVSIARAIALRPAVLVCDEPVAALDVTVQAQVLELLRELRRTQGLALLFVTHDLAVARQMCDELLVLHRGVVVERGAVDEVLDRPRHPTTRALLDAVPTVAQHGGDAGGGR